MTPEILVQLQQRVECGIEYLNTTFKDWTDNLIYDGISHRRDIIKEIDLDSSNLHILSHATGVDYNIAFVDQDNYESSIVPEFIRYGLKLPPAEEYLYPYLNELWRHKIQMMVLDRLCEPDDEIYDKIEGDT